MTTTGSLDFHPIPECKTIFNETEQDEKMNQKAIQFTG